MFRTIVAKYAGKCGRCGKDVPAGSKVRYGYRKVYHMKADCPQAQAEEAWDVYTSISATA